MLGARQAVYPSPLDPFIPVARYNLAISLIQNFDEMEGKSR